MPERSICTECWTESAWFQGLTQEQRYLFLYLCTNQHCKQAGLYYITLITISFETKIPDADLPLLLKALAPRVEWYPDRNLIWVKNFIKRQSKSPKFLIAVAKCLSELKGRDKSLAGELIEYNYNIHNISIPYEDSIGSIPIPTKPKPNTNTNGNSIPSLIPPPSSPPPPTPPTLGGNIYTCWNEQKIIEHKKLTTDTQRAINTVLKDYAEDEVCQAIKNYAEILNDEQYYFKYKWTLKDFLKRGLAKFLNLEIAKTNYARGSKGGTHKRDTKAAGYGELAASIGKPLR